VIEKPHSQLRGRFFAGFIKMPAQMWNVLPGLRRSSRNEYEVTDIINSAERRVAIDLSETYMIWDSITFASDVERIQNLLM
jgi:dTDP-glucose pyrophosphorylase